MTSQIKNYFLKTLLGVFMISSFVVACNNSGEKKDEGKAKDTTKTETVTPPASTSDSTKKGGDSADTRPVKPGE
jgi:hypothetical protein